MNALFCIALVHPEGVAVLYVRAVSISLCTYLFIRSPDSSVVGDSVSTSRMIIAVLVKVAILKLIWINVAQRWIVIDLLWQISYCVFIVCVSGLLKIMNRVL
jgi:hypothetical protein